jgi:DNA repair protein RAD50
MELKERDLLSEIREKNNLEEQVVKMKNDVVLHTAQLKVSKRLLSEINPDRPA